MVFVPKRHDKNPRKPLFARNFGFKLKFSKKYKINKEGIKVNINSAGSVFSLFRSLTDTKSITGAPVEYATEKPPFDPHKKGTSLPRATPESQGVPSSLLLYFAKMLRTDKTIETHNVMVLRHGKIIFEASFDDGSIGLWKQTFSACKSIVSLAVGFAVDDGLLELDTLLCDIFPDEVSAVSKRALKEVTVRHLLTMTTSVSFSEADSVISESWIRGYMTSSPKEAVGEVFSYNSMNTYMLAAAVSKLSGKSLTDYLGEKLFAPLGIENVYWEKSPDGIEKGGWGLYIAPEDMAKIGLLVLGGGVYGGRRLISAEYISEMTRTQIKTPEHFGRFDYGYQTWCGRDTNSFLFSGMLDQNVLGFKDKNILVLVNSGNNSLFQQSAFFTYAFECFGDMLREPLSNEVLPENTAAAKELEAYLDSCRIKGAVFEGLPEECELLCGKRFEPISADSASTGLLPVALQMLYNNYTSGLKSISFEIKDGKFYVYYRENDALHRFPIGFSKPAAVNMKFRKTVFRVAVSGEFAKNEDGISVLKLRLAFSETPCVRYIKFFFEDGEALAYHRETPGMAFASDGIMNVKRSLEEKKLIRGAVGMVDEDYIEYKIKKTFAPKIIMKKIN